MRDDARVRTLLTRRRLLGLGATLGGLAVLAGSGAAWVLWPRPAAAGRRVLSPAECRVVDAVADAYLPPGNPFGVTASAVDVAGGVDDYIAALPHTQARLLRGLLVALDQWPRLALQSPRPFAALSLEDRIRVLAAFETSALAERRQIAGLLRLVVGIPYFEDARVMAAAGTHWGCGAFS